jgi:hypothetical protein
MRAAVAATNLILGVAYTSYGIMTAIELKRGWRVYGFSHFGAAWIAMAFTCGPHHLAHGIHAAVGNRAGGGLDLFAVVVGLPVGVIWLLLRIEAFTGGQGDRFISDTPGWLTAMPTLGAVYLTALGAAVVWKLAQGVTFDTAVLPNFLLLFIYSTIGYYLLRTQLRNHKEIGGWSVSGLSLAAVFPTCGIMHVIWALYVSTGLYAADRQGFVIDWIAVPAGLYFLWVVSALYRNTLRDWNSEESERATYAVAG